MEIQTYLKPSETFRTIFHCDTQEKAREFYDKISRFGVLWLLGGKLKESYWDIYRKNTCYKIYYNSDGDPIYICCANYKYYANDDAKYRVIEYQLDAEEGETLDGKI